MYWEQAAALLLYYQFFFQKKVAKSRKALLGDLQCHTIKTKLAFSAKMGSDTQTDRWKIVSLTSASIINEPVHHRKSRSQKGQAYLNSHSFNQRSLYCFLWEALVELLLWRKHCDDSLLFLPMGSTSGTLTVTANVTTLSFFFLWEALVRLLLWLPMWRLSPFSSYGKH